MNRTKFQIELDDDSMVELIEQCVVARCSPPLFLTELVKDVLARAREDGLQIIVPIPGESFSKH